MVMACLCRIGAGPIASKRLSARNTVGELASGNVVTLLHFLSNRIRHGGTDNRMWSRFPRAGHCISVLNCKFA